MSASAAADADLAETCNDVSRSAPGVAANSIVPPDPIPRFPGGMSMFAAWLRFALAALTFTAPVRAVSDVFACSESGLSAAITAGGGPHTFDCAEPTAAELTITSDVSIDGNDLLTIDGGDHHRILSIAVGARVELQRLTLTRGNSAVGTRWGGAIRNDGDLTLDRVTVSHSRATLRGAGIANTGSLMVVSSRLVENGIAPAPGTPSVQGGAIYSHAGVVVVDATVVEGNQAAAGAGILSLGRLEVHRSRIARNDHGAVEVNGPTTIADTTIAENHTKTTCGGLFMGRVSDASVVRTTFRDNRSENACGAIGVSGRLVLVNSTVTRNASRLQRSGGIDVFDPSTTALVVNSTIVDNEGPEAGGIYVFQGHVVLRGSIVAGNRTAAGGVECRTATSEAFLDSDGGNVFDEGGCPASSSDVAIPPDSLFTHVLGPLAANGGPTQTYLPLRGSPALDVVPDVLCEASAELPLTEDQRGLPRPWDGDQDGVARCDAGAVERVVQSAAITIFPRFFPWSLLSWSNFPVWVVLFGSPSLDVRSIPLDSVTFGPGAANPTGIHPSQVLDVNRDGTPDLVLRFRLLEMGIGPADEEACLGASLVDGVLIDACGAIRVLQRGGRN